MQPHSPPSHYARSAARSRADANTRPVRKHAHVRFCGADQRGRVVVPCARSVLGWWPTAELGMRSAGEGVEMRFTRLNESDEYRRQREELRVAEVELIDHVERVAALRRELTADTVVDNYELVEVSSGDRVRLSELFSAPDRALVLYHFMYGKAQTEPCPLCTMWIDGYNAAAPHLSPNVDFAVVAAAEPAAIEAHAASRGWNNLRL